MANHTSPEHRPIIAVAWPKADYLEALTRAGAQPRVLDPAHDALPGVLADCDGVLLTGGVDVDPQLYGESERHPTVELDATRDAYEVALTRHALARDLPLLAICRGVQVLNVVAGGSLIQDLPSQHPSSIHHSISVPKNAIAHDVRIEPGTCLSVLLTDRLAGGDRTPVNSRHHQSVNVVAPGFIASATAPDGVIEAIERPSSRFCVGVQWHPENFWASGDFAPLFEGFVRAATTVRGAGLQPGPFAALKTQRPG